MRATFPHLALWQEAQFWLTGQSLDPQESISGVETIVPTMRARWNASVNFALRGEHATVQWQGFLAQMQGHVGTTLVPARSRFRPKDRDGHHLSFCDEADLKGKAGFFEHFSLENTDVNRVELSASAALRATQIAVTLNNSTGLRPGQYFSIGERLYRVQASWNDTATSQTLMIEPPLREAVSNGTRLEIEKPVCRMRFTTETEGLFDQSMAVLPRVTINFVEAI